MSSNLGFDAAPTYPVQKIERIVRPGLIGGKYLANNPELTAIKYRLIWL